MTIEVENSLNKLIFLLDSQADISILKFSSLPRETTIDKNDIIYIKRITSERQKSLGTAKIALKIKHLIIEHRVNLVTDEFMIPSNGIIGRDFLRKFDCLIDYAKNEVTIRPTGVPQAQIPLEIEVTKGVSALPPQCETFKLFRVRSSSFPCVIPAQEIDENIFIPTTIAFECEAFIRVLNTNSEMKIINTSSGLKTEPLNAYEVFTASKNSGTNSNSNRRENL